MININQQLKLKGMIISKFGTQQEFAKHIGKSQQTVTAKLNGRSKFSQDDIIEWCNALDIKASNVGRIFFDQQLSKS